MRYAIFQMMRKAMHEQVEALITKQWRVNK